MRAMRDSRGFYAGSTLILHGSYAGGSGTGSGRPRDLGLDLTGRGVSNWIWPAEGSRTGSGRPRGLGLDLAGRGVSDRIWPAEDVGDKQTPA